MSSDDALVIPIPTVIPLPEVLAQVIPITTVVVELGDLNGREKIGFPVISQIVV